MNDKWKRAWERFKAPPIWAIVLNAFVMLVSVVLSLCSLAWQDASLVWQICAYVAYAVAACSLGYFVYTTVRFAPKCKRFVIERAERYEFTRSLLRNYGFRTMIFTLGSFTMSVVFGIYNGVLGILWKSMWFGALSAYYIMLALLRGSVWSEHKRRKRREGEAEESKAWRQVRVYRNCGAALLVLNLALSSAIAQMIFADEKFVYYGWTIYAFAAYAFYKITMSVVNFVKAKKQEDLAVEAVRNVNLADGAVSILALQTALLGTFRTEGLNVALYHTLTGSAVSLLTVGLGVYMLVRAAKKKKVLQGEERNGRGTL